MQRVHEDDLTGYLLENSTDWTHIKIPEVAMTDETWTVGSKVFHRAMGRPGIEKSKTIREHKFHQYMKIIYKFPRLFNAQNPSCRQPKPSKKI